MAWYGSVTVRYRGRLVEVGLRYAGYNGTRVLKGKTLDTNGYDGPDDRRIAKMLPRVRRRDPGPFEPPDY
jgi:hypothetical protein